MIRYSIGRTVSDVHPAQVVAPTLDAFVTVLKNSATATKDGSPYYSGPMGGDGRRCAENAEPRNTLVLDADTIAALIFSTWRAVLRVRFCGAVHSTHSSTPEEPRDRAILLLTRPITRAEGILLGRVIVAQLEVPFGEHVVLDPSTFRPEQPCFVPPLGVEIQRLEGPLLDVDACLAQAAALPVEALDLPPAEWTTECVSGYSSSITDLPAWLQAQPDTTRRDTGKSADRMAFISKALRAAGLNCEEAFEALQHDPRAVKNDRFDLLHTEITKCLRKILQDDADALVAAGFGAESAPPEGTLPSIVAAAVPPPPQRAPRVSLADLHSNPSPPQRFVWDLWLPFGTVTLLGAHGGAGKSQLVLHLAVCVALGLPFMGTKVEQTRVLVFSGEDPTRIVRRRFAKICTALGVDPAALAKQLLVLDATADPTLYAGGFVESEPAALMYLAEDIREFRPGLLILDNASDVFAGSEISRPEVRGFMRLIASLGASTDAAVLLLAHVDKVGVKTGSSEAYSGSTAWHNSARSRWFLSSTPGGLLQLEHSKSNLGPKADPLYLKWSGDGLIEPTDAPGGADDRETILTLIEAVTARGDAISPFPKSHNNAYKVLQREPCFPRGMTRDALEDVLATLRGSRQLIHDEIRGKNRKLSTVLRSVRSHASSYEGAPPPECALSAHRGVGRERAHGQVLPFRVSARAVNDVSADPEEHF